ncbi:MAG TPA: TlpA disulfide reductase family protein [Candidatus Elarobacter sp.]|jgi:thiol-disulfide isomerase/thioredoxin
MSRATAKSPAPDRRKLILYIVLAAVIVAIVVYVGLASRTNVVPKAASQAPMNSKLKPGDTAPAFAVQTNAGPFDLAQVSTPVLLEVFATWCPHCQRETAVLNDLSSKYAGKLAIVAVSGSPYAIDGSSPESQTDVNRFGEQFQVRYPLAFDQDLKVAQLYLQGGFPTLVLIDKNKKIKTVKSGEVTPADLQKAIDPVL